VTTLLENYGPVSKLESGGEIHSFARELYPICRSITGDGIRDTLRLIGEKIPLEISEVPSGTAVFDWTIPKEWNVRDAYIKDKLGRRVVDFKQHSLHVLNYSTPVDAKLVLAELKEHLHTLPEHPDWIPYKTSYYQPAWGFCMAHNAMLALADGEYEVRIDSTLEDGSLTYGECFLPGTSSEEILISAHSCHPSLANDNLSGIGVATFLAQEIAKREHRFSYRFIFAPGTIGAIAWLARNRETAQRVRHGLVLTCIGDVGGFHYKKSRRGDAEIDRAIAHVLKHCGEMSEILDFSPNGYDERQYCSPGFNLPVGCLMRSVWGTFPEYHTSADNLEFISPESLARSMQVCASVFDLLEGNRTYRNLSSYCEPQLGRRGLYRSIGEEPMAVQMNARLWVLNLSDGEHSLLDIAERSGVKFSTIYSAAELLHEGGLLEEVTNLGSADTSQ
jgi:aminopeptidase-like protein